MPNILQDNVVTRYNPHYADLTGLSTGRLKVDLPEGKGL